MPRMAGAPRRGAPSFLPLLGLITFAALFVATLYPSARVLGLEVENRLIWSTPAHCGDEIVFSHLHSVENTPVKEFFSLEGDAFRLVRAETRALGAGLPVPPTGGFALVGGTFVQDFDLRLPQLDFMLTPSTLPALYLTGERIDLSTYPVGTSLSVKIVRRPLLWLRLRRILP